MLYDDLVKRLRYAASYDERIVIETCKEAADAIEKLQLYVDLYKDLTEKGEKVAREVLGKYPKWIPVTEENDGEV